MARKATVGTPRRGEIYLVNFDPTVGAEIKKTRPALVLQNDIANRYSPITIVAEPHQNIELHRSLPGPMTSKNSVCS